MSAGHGSRAGAQLKAASAMALLGGLRHVRPSLCPSPFALKRKMTSPLGSTVKSVDSV